MEEANGNRKVLSNKTTKPQGKVHKILIKRTFKPDKMTYIPSTQEGSFTSSTGNRSFNCEEDTSFMRGAEGARE